MEWRRGREKERERERKKERKRKRGFFEYYSQEKEELESYLPSDTLDRLCGS